MSKITKTRIFQNKKRKAKVDNINREKEICSVRRFIARQEIKNIQELARREGKRVLPKWMLEKKCDK